MHSWCIILVLQVSYSSYFTIPNECCLVRLEIQPVFELTYVGHISPVKSRRFNDRPIAARNLIHSNSIFFMNWPTMRVNPWQNIITTYTICREVEWQANYGRNLIHSNNIFWIQFVGRFDDRPIADEISYILTIYFEWIDPPYYCPEAGYCMNA